MSLSCATGSVSARGPIDLSPRGTPPSLAHILVLVLAAASLEAAPAFLPNTVALTNTGDLSAAMREGTHRFLERLTENSLATRGRFWRRDLSSATAYLSSVQSNRQELARLIGAVDPRPERINLELIGTPGSTIVYAESDLCTIHLARWLAYGEVHAEGLLLRPKLDIRARVIAIPDADQTPEGLAGLRAGPGSGLARRLAEAGCEVLVPALVDRSDAASGNAQLDRWTNQSHREWIYRQAFTVGRHIIGYEVQKVLAGLDWFAQQPAPLPLGVVGYGEGGLIALYTSALDTRPAVTLVSGYFQSRQNVWTEPIYRNVFGLLRRFGDAELASLIAPRPLIVEHSEFPSNTGPRPIRPGREGAAPGRLQTPDQWLVEGELLRLGEWFPRHAPIQPQVRLLNGSEGATVEPGSRLALIEVLRALKVDPSHLNPGAQQPLVVHWQIDPAERQLRQVRELELHTQQILNRAEQARADFFWSRLSGPDPQAAKDELRSAFANDLVGMIETPLLPLEPRSRLILEGDRWNAYEITLPVWPDVFAWGVLLIPTSAGSGPRPVVVCQHGLEGLPLDTIGAPPDSQAYGYYKNFAARLAESGYVVFAPHNFYRGGQDFRQIQRRANPLGLSLYSIFLAQHRQILAWLRVQPFVDPARIGFYGLSYGGKSALYLPAVLEGYCLSICSANFNDWARKLADVTSPYSYLYTGEYEMPEFNLANTFSHAELGALICPRPLMVERGHQDGVAPDQWVAYEYAKVRKHYVGLEHPERTQIAFFQGGHSIDGTETFEFLNRFLHP